MTKIHPPTDKMLTDNVTLLRAQCGAPQNPTHVTYRNRKTGNMKILHTMVGSSTSFLPPNAYARKICPRRQSDDFNIAAQTASEKVWAFSIVSV